MTAWEDFGLEVAKWVCWIFAAAIGVGVLIAASAWLRDYMERRMWEHAEAEAAAALASGDAAARSAAFQAHVTDAFNVVLGLENTKPHLAAVPDEPTAEVIHLARVEAARGLTNENIARVLSGDWTTDNGDAS